MYPDFSRDRHVRPHADLVERVDDRRVYGYDHGWDDPRVVLEVGFTEYDQLAVLDEFYKSGVEYDRAIKWLQTNDKPQGTVYSEHEPEHQRAFRRAGYRVDPANKDLDEGIPAVRDRLDWRDDPQGRPGLLLSDRCVETIRELMDYQEEEVGTSAAVDHSCDSLRYLVMGVDGETKTAGGVTDSSEVPPANTGDAAAARQSSSRGKIRYMRILLFKADLLLVGNIILLCYCKVTKRSSAFCGDLERFPGRHSALTSWTLVQSFG